MRNLLKSSLSKSESVLAPASQGNGRLMSTRKPSAISKWAAAASLSSAGFSAQAIDVEDVLQFSTGSLRLRTYVTVSETYHDNIFYSDDDTESDLITSVSPGLSLLWGREEDDYLSAGYQFNQSLYLDNSDVNGETHSLSLDHQKKFSRLETDGVLALNYLTTVLDGGEIIGTRSVAIDRWRIDANENVEYALGEKTAIGGGFTYSSIDFRSVVGINDREQIRGLGRFFYDYSQKTRFFGEGFYGGSSTKANLPIPDGPTSNFYGGFIGAQGSFTEKLSGTIKVGYEERDFSDGTKGPSSPAADIAISYKITPKNLTTLSYWRGTRHSIQDAQSSFLADDVSLKITQNIGDSGRLLAIFSALYSHRDFENFQGMSGRADTVIAASLSAAYRMNAWSQVVGSYSFGSYDSNLAGLDYKANQVTLGLAIGY